MAFHGISDLKAIRKYNWKIKVRVINKWCERNAFTGRRNGLNLILVDEAVSVNNCLHFQIIFYNVNEVNL